jgi:hypothetical protein
MEIPQRSKVKKHIRYAKPGDIVILRIYSPIPSIKYDRICTVLKIFDTEESWVLKYTCVGTQFKEGKEIVSWKTYDKFSMDNEFYYEYFITEV